ncbi:hypothetical protein [Peijinzhouia sedimentorum]
MTTKNFTPEQSLDIIMATISHAKSRFQEDGSIYIMWGILTALASFSQYYLLTIERYDINYYPYFIMPIGGIITGIYYSKKAPSKANPLSRFLSFSWIIIALNIMVLGFFFNSFLQSNLIPIILILLGIGIFISGAAIRSGILLFSGIILNLSGLVCFYIGWQEHALVMGIVGILAILLPGVILKMNSKKEHV